jgi:hypothetical protein
MYYCFNTQNFLILSTECIYWFCISLEINNNYSLENTKRLIFVTGKHLFSVKWELNL